MAKRVCAERGCPRLVQAGTRDGRCPEHQRSRDQARGTSSSRGYGHSHRRLRADYQRRMDAGETFDCARCGSLIQPAEPWDLGHDDTDRSKWIGPEHQRCNRATAGRR